MKLKKYQKIFTGVYIIAFLFDLYRVFNSDDGIAISFWLGWILIYIIVITMMNGLGDE